MNSAQQRNDRMQADTRTHIAAAARLAIADRELLKDRTLDEIVENGTWLAINQPPELFEAAARRARAELAMEPGSATGMVRLARCLGMVAPGLRWKEQSRLAAEADQLFESALQVNDQDVDALLGKAFLLLRAARWQSDEEAVRTINLSIDYISRAFKVSGDSYRVQHVRGIASMRLALLAPTHDGAIGLYEQAVHYFSAALDLRGDFYPAMTSRGWTLHNYAANEIEGPEADDLIWKANESFREALAIHPTHEDSLLGLGNSLVARSKLMRGGVAGGLLNKAVKIYEQTHAAWPHSFDVLNHWGNAIFEQARRAGGAEIDRLCALATVKYNEALADNPDYAAPHANLGSLSIFEASATSGPGKARLANQACEFLRAALDLKPDYRWALARMAAALRMLAMFEPNDTAADTFARGVEKCRAALARRPDYHGALEEWARNLIAQAERTVRPEGIKLLREAAGKAGQVDGSWFMRESSMLVQGDCLYHLALRQSWPAAAAGVDEAAQVYARARAAWPGSHQALRGFGRTLVFKARRAGPGEAEAAFGHAYETFSAALGERPGAHDVLADWGNALRLQADVTPGRRKRLLEEAEEKLQSALSLLPEHTYCLVVLATVLEDKARLNYGPERDSIIERARQLLDAALKSEPLNSFALCVMGNVLMRQAERSSRADALELYVEAAAKFKQALQVTPDDAWALERSGWALLYQARLRYGADALQLYAAADEQFEAALRVEPDSPSRLNSRALALAARARHDPEVEPAELYRQAYELFGASANIWANARTHLLWANTLVSEAVQSDHRHEENASSDELYFEANVHFDIARYLDKSSWEIHRDMALALLSRARRVSGTESEQWLADAENLLGQALSLNAPRELILLDRASLDIERARGSSEKSEKDDLTSRAIVNLREAAQINPNFDAALYALAHAFNDAPQRVDNLAEAEQWYARAHAAATHRPEILLNWARLLRVNKKYKMAAEKAKAALALDPDQVEAHRLRADMLEREVIGTADPVMEGRAYEEAEAHLREALRIRPDSAGIRSEFAHILIHHAVTAEPARRRSLIEQAVLQYDDSVLLEPNSVAPLTARANALEKLADVDPENAVEHLNRAFADLNRALSLDPAEPQMVRRKIVELLRRRARHEGGPEREATLREAAEFEGAAEGPP